MYEIESSAWAGIQWLLSTAFAAKSLGAITIELIPVNAESSQAIAPQRMSF